MISSAVALLIGVAIGFIAGLFGVGGGFLIVPALTFAGLPLSIAIGTSLACITVGSMSSTAMHVRGGRVLYRVALMTAAFSIPMAIAGSYLSTVIDEGVIRVLFAFLLLYLAYTFARPDNEGSGDGVSEVKYRHVPFIGAFSGLASGLLGVSGGIINVPLFHELAGIPVKYAVGTSSLALFFTSLTAAYAHYTLGQVDITTAAMIVPGLMAGSFVGAHLVSRVPAGGLKRAFAGLLVLTAVKMLV
ncbi:sulfite exporter TauE/SafE family protein [Thermococcus sp. MV11]|uniref:sulfite exporter TauE/SafE family protein n=1 Tax=Thermococcus sp. MV11 TaxID=1638267 RepID=UPI0014321836|nr:sulfite exporter TauE/SafE family protein [Thermococcus sp. MV11]